jgi:hypothetical protein
MKAAVTSRVFDDAIEAVVGFLQLHEVDDGAEVIAEMQIAGRLNA